METTTSQAPMETEWQSPKLEILETRLQLERLHHNCTGLLFVEANTLVSPDGINLPSFPCQVMISKHESPNAIAYYVHFSDNREVTLIGTARRAHAQATALAAD